MKNTRNVLKTVIALIFSCLLISPAASCNASAEESEGVDSGKTKKRLVFEKTITVLPRPAAGGKTDSMKGILKQLSEQADSPPVYMRTGDSAAERADGGDQMEQLPPPEPSYEKYWDENILSPGERRLKDGDPSHGDVDIDAVIRENLAGSSGEFKSFNMTGEEGPARSDVSIETVPGIFSEALPMPEGEGYRVNSDPVFTQGLRMDGEAAPKSDDEVINIYSKDELTAITKKDAFTDGSSYKAYPMLDGIETPNKQESTERYGPNLTIIKWSDWDNFIPVSRHTGTHSDDAIYTGDTAYIDYAFANNGDTSIYTTFSVGLYINGELVSGYNYNSLLAGYYYAFEDVGYTFSTAGTYTFTLICDVFSTIVESNENDNIYERSKVVGTPNLTAALVTGWSDVIVVSKQTGTNTNDDIYAGSVSYIDFAYGNNGTGNITNTFYVDFYINGNKIFAWQDSLGLNQGSASAVVDFGITFTDPGTYTLKIICDPTNVIPESNELDNQYQRYLTVLNASKPNLRPYKPDDWADTILVSKQTGTRTDDTIYAGGIGYIDYAVVNDGTADAGPYKVNMYINGTLLNVAEGTGLTKLTYTSLNDTPYTFSQAGTYTLKIVCDPAGSVAESNESDNEYQRSKSVAAAGSPNLRPYQTSGWSDTIVVSAQTGTHTDTTVYTGNKAYIDYTFVNDSSQDISNPFLVALYINGKTVQIGQVPNITQGRVLGIEDFEYTFSQPGTNTIKLVCDLNNDITESNENDNTYERGKTLSDNTQPPPNDLFANAVGLSGESGRTTGSNRNAGKETGEPNHAHQYGVHMGGRSVWWRWTAPASEYYMFNTVFSSFSTLLGVYTGSQVDGLTEVASNCNGIGYNSMVRFKAAAGTPYYIAVDGEYAEYGDIIINWRKLSRPANDDAANAAVLTGAAGQTTGVNGDATRESAEPYHASYRGERSVWWQWTPASTGDVYFDTHGSDFTTLLAVYTGTQFQNFTEITSNIYDTCFMLLGIIPIPIPGSGLAFRAQAGTRYLIAVDSYPGESGGNIVLKWRTAAPPANDNFASAVSLSGASGQTTGSNADASKETGELFHPVYKGGKSVWWKWTAPSTGPFVFDSTGSKFYTSFAIAAGSSVNALAWITDEVGFNTNLLIHAVSGTQYYIMVDGKYGLSGDIALSWSSLASKSGQYAMNLNGRVFLNESQITQTGYRIVAFGPGGDTDCRGIADILYSGGDWRYAMSLTSNKNGERISFKIWNPHSGQFHMAADTIVFETGSTLTRDIDRPLRLDSVYPTLGELNTPLNAALSGMGFEQNVTRVSMSAASGNARKMKGFVVTPGDAEAVVIDGTRAYVADGCRGLQIIDVTDPNNPEIMGGVVTPGFAHRVAVSGNTAYVGDDWGGLQVINVTNPSRPEIIGSVPGPSQMGAAGVAVANGIAYVAYGNSVENTGGLQIVNVGNPNTPQQITFLNTGASTYNLEVENNRAYVTCRGLLKIIDVTNPASPNILGSAATPGRCLDVAVSGIWAYVADSETGVQTINVGNPYDPVLIGPVSSSLMGTSGVMISGDKLYAADMTAGLQVIDISEPLTPDLTGSVVTSSIPGDVAAVPPFAYVTYPGMGLQIIDVSDLKTPNIVGDANTSGYAYGVKVVDTIAYVTDVNQGLQVVNIADPKDPRIMGSKDTPGQAVQVDVANKIAYVADFYGGVQVINASDSSNPQQIAAITLPGYYAKEVTIVNTTAYIAWGRSYVQGGRLQIVNVATPSNPVQIGFVDIPGWSYSVSVSGNLAAVISSVPSSPENHENSLHIVNVSNPASPSVAGYFDVTDAPLIHVRLSGNRAYLLSGAGLYILDISTPASPVLMGSLAISGSPRHIKLDGTRAYVSNSSQGLEVIDVSNPYTPYRVGFVDTLGSAIASDLIPNGQNMACVADFDRGLVITKLPIEITPVAVTGENAISITIPSPDQAGDYTLHVLNHSKAHELQGAVTFITPDDNEMLLSKAIIVAGGGPTLTPNIWNEIERSANTAYQALLKQGYRHEDILYLSAVTGGSGVDGAATYQSVSNAIQVWAQDASELLVYFVDHGIKGQFVINPTEKLSVKDLDQWLDALQTSKGIPVVFIYDACQSGTFIGKPDNPLMAPPPGKVRVVITSASDEDARFTNRKSFSYLFWQAIEEGDSLDDAFNYGKDELKNQSPLLDADGNAVVNQPNDKKQANVKVRRGFPSEIHAPVIGRVSDPADLNGAVQSTLRAWDIKNKKGGITRVWAEIIPPNIDFGSPDTPITDDDLPPDFELTDANKDGIYEGTYTGFTVTGTYMVSVYAMNSLGNISPPVMTTVTQNAGNSSDQADSQEVDDTAPEAKAAVLNRNVSHNFHDPGDADWVKFYALAAKTYAIEARNVSAVCDPVIRLYGTNAASLITEKNDKIAGSTERLEWTFAQEGIYYVKIENADPGIFGRTTSYDLEIYQPIGSLRGEINGLVTDKTTRVRIEGVRIKTSDSPALSQSDGYYCLENAPGASLTLRAEADGYEVYTSPAISLSEGQILEHDIILTPRSNLLKGDLDLDNDVDLSDVLLGLRIMAGDKNLPARNYLLGDTNSDGKITTADLLYILRKAAGY